MINEQNAQRVLDALKEDAQRTKSEAAQYLSVMSGADVDRITANVAARFNTLIARHHAYLMLNAGTRTVQPDHVLNNALAVEQYVLGYVTSYDAPEWRDILSVMYLAATD